MIVLNYVLGEFVGLEYTVILTNTQSVTLELN